MYLDPSLVTHGLIIIFPGSLQICVLLTLKAGGNLVQNVADRLQTGCGMGGASREPARKVMPLGNKTCVVGVPCFPERTMQSLLEPALATELHWGIAKLDKLNFAIPGTR